MVPRIHSFNSIPLGLPIPKFGRTFFDRISQERLRRVVRHTRRVFLTAAPVLIGFCVLGYIELRIGGKLSSIILWDGGALAAVVIAFWIMDRLKFRSMSKAAHALMKRRLEEPDQLAAPHRRDYPLSEDTRAKIDAARGNQQEFLLAPIDMSGRAMCEYGVLPFVPSVTAGEFSPRDRYNIDIVLYGDSVLLRKNYRGNWRQCVREWFNFEQMYKKARVPVVRKVDVANGVLYMDYIYGRTLLEILRDNGALMRDADVEHDPAFVGLNGEERQRKLDERGQAVLASVFPEEFLCKVDLLIEDIHGCRVSDLDIRFANIIRGVCGIPWMIDFHDARTYPAWAEYLFRFKRNGDILSYARVFGRTLPERSRGRIAVSDINGETHPQQSGGVAAGKNPGCRIGASE